MVGGDVGQAQRTSTQGGLYPDFEIAVSALIGRVGEQLSVRRDGRLRGQTGARGEPLEHELVGCFAEVTPGKDSRNQNGAACDARRNGPPRQRGRRNPLEAGDVGAFRNVDADSVAATLGLVVFLQARAQAAGLDSPDRVGARIVAGGFVADLPRQCVLFELLRAARQSLFNTETRAPSESTGMR